MSSIFRLLEPEQKSEVSWPEALCNTVGSSQMCEYSSSKVGSSAECGAMSKWYLEHEQKPSGYLVGVQLEVLQSVVHVHCPVSAGKGYLEEQWKSRG